ncbi:DoxX family protein [Fibrella aquatilis]|uniref:DoxX family protein n=1 Tax=Fibrella aquatilis TaxID=2817059 RepID=A0A939G7F1_9BACT|nr:DoxX family protein [Fibrella aquatilis]MBO0932024.1 DoxX family protein [Fibrella aquatilis]
MNTILWLVQVLLSLEFGYSGVMKATQSAPKLVAMGQTGVEHLPLPLIRFIGLAELVGVVGLLLPGLVHRLLWLTPLAAGCLGLIMIPAGIIHYQRGEYKTIWINVITLALCLLVVYGRYELPR